MVLVVAAAVGLVTALMALRFAVADEGLRLVVTVVAAVGAVVLIGFVIGLAGVVDTKSTTEATGRVEVAQEAAPGDDRPSYDDTRVALGLATAGAFLLVAVGLWRRTDWTAVGGDPFAGVEAPSDPFEDRGPLSGEP